MIEQRLRTPIHFVNKLNSLKYLYWFGRITQGKFTNLVSCSFWAFSKLNTKLRGDGAETRSWPMKVAVTEWVCQFSASIIISSKWLFGYSMFCIPSTFNVHWVANITFSYHPHIMFKSSSFTVGTDQNGALWSTVNDFLAAIIIGTEWLWPVGAHQICRSVPRDLKRVDKAAEWQSNTCMYFVFCMIFSLHCLLRLFMFLVVFCMSCPDFHHNLSIMNSPGKRRKV